MRRVGAIGIGLIALALVFSAGTPAVYAGACASGNTCTFELTVSNVPQLSPIDVRVIWNNTTAQTTFSVQWISGGPGTPGFINEFGYNAAVDTSTVFYDGNDVSSLWTLNGVNAQIDGFGNFARDDSNGPTAQGQREGISKPIVFTLASLVTSIPTTSTGTEFVVHVGGYTNGCSGFVGEAGSTPGTTSTPSCAAVAEPAVLLLTGVGFAGVGYMARRRSWFSRLAC
jgi:hypothetical protein